MLYNLQILKEYFRGDKGFELDMIQIFLEQAPDFTTQIQQLYYENKIDKIGKLAHSFKSSIDIFEMKELRQFLDTIEKIGAGEEDATKLKTILEKTNSMINELIILIAEEKEKY